MKIKNNYFSSFCLVCGAQEIIKIGKISYLKPVKFSNFVIDLENEPELWECQVCRSWFTNYIIDEETSKRLYTISESHVRWNNQERFENSKPEDIIKKLGQLFFKECKVLDIGCNTGSLLDFARDRGCITYGVELSIDSRRIVNSKSHYCFAELDDISDMNFDLIFAFDLVEHIYNIKTFLKKCNELLSPQGKLVLLTGNKDCLSAKLAKNNWWYLKYPEYIIFPSKKFFVEYSGFKLLCYIETYNSRGYQVGLYNAIYRLFKSIIRGTDYDGLPSIGPDHHLLVLGKENETRE